MIESYYNVSPWEFDQPPTSVWRTVSPYTGINMIKRYLKIWYNPQTGTWKPDTPAGNITLEPTLFFWHLGQLIAIYKNEQEALQYFYKSTTTDSNWNCYVWCTIYFISKDKKQFDKVYEKVLTASFEENDANFKIIKNFNNNFTQSYANVYIDY